MVPLELSHKAPLHSTFPRMELACKFVHSQQGGRFQTSDTFSQTLPNYTLFCKHLIYQFCLSIQYLANIHNLPINYILSPSPPSFLRHHLPLTRPLFSCFYYVPSSSVFPTNTTLVIFLKSFPDGSVGKESTYSAGDTGDASSIPESGRSPEEGNDNIFQYSC